MTKEEILKLHTLSEEEQLLWLAVNEILIKTQHMCHYINTKSDSYYLHESLADCAFRMRDETSIGDWVEAGRELHRHIPTYQMQVQSFLRFKAQPIHWIQAALLAKLESK